MENDLEALGLVTFQRRDHVHIGTNLSIVRGIRIRQRAINIDNQSFHFLLLGKEPKHIVSS